MEVIQLLYGYRERSITCVKLPMLGYTFPPDIINRFLLNRVTISNSI